MQLQPRQASPSTLARRAVLALGMLAAATLAAPVLAATTCFNEACTACSPPAPVEVSTLIGPTDFPPGADTPIAFVDPGEGGPLRLVATQEGMILVWDGATDSILPTPFLDLTAKVACCGERGLLAMAADPDYTTTGHLYVYYTRTGPPADLGDIVIERYTRSVTDPAVGNPASATTILVIEHSSAGNHNGGNLAFGPDGFLYVSVGDGGGGCDSGAGTSGDGQRRDTLLGKLLRLDVRGVDPSGGPPDDCGVGLGNYTVPSDNPFVGEEPDCDEVWTMGLRNPFRFTFDRNTGDIYIGDVGQNKWEEINLLRASTAAPANFGWVCREGCETAGNNESKCATGGCLPDAGTTCEFPRTTGGFWDPILCHHNGGWQSIMGGYRYRGSFVPSIAGDYLYGDAACGQIWKTSTLDPANPAAIDAACFSSGFGGTYGFAEDHLGELYVVVGGGPSPRIDCIHNGEGCFWAGWEIFADGFEAGNTNRWSASAP